MLQPLLPWYRAQGSSPAPAARTGLAPRNPIVVSLAPPTGGSEGGTPPRYGTGAPSTQPVGAGALPHNVIVVSAAPPGPASQGGPALGNGTAVSLAQPAGAAQRTGTAVSLAQPAGAAQRTGTAVSLAQPAGAPQTGAAPRGGAAGTPTPPAGAPAPETPGGAPALAGRADLTARVSGTAASPVVALSLAARDVRIAGTTFQQIRADAVRVAEGRLNLGRVDLLHQGAPGFISGFLPFRWHATTPGSPFAPHVPPVEPMSLVVSLPPHDLSYAAALTSAVQAASGTFHANLTIAGTPRTPQMAGTLGVRNGTFKLAAMKDPLTGVTAAAHLDGPSVILDTFQVEAPGGGRLTAGGRAVLRGAGATIDLQMRAQDFPLSLQAIGTVSGLDFRGITNGQLALQGPLALGESAGPRPVLRGQIALSRVVFDVPANLEPRAPVRLRLPINPDLDINVSVGADSLVRRGSAIRAYVAGSLSARGTLADAVLDGQARVQRGEMRFAGYSFRLQEGGTLSFRYASPGPLNANVNLSASTSISAYSPAIGDIQRYRVTLAVSGPLARMNVAVSSDPPDLTQQRILALLVRADLLDAVMTGRTGEAYVGEQVQQLLTGALLPFAFDPIERGIADLFGLQSVTFQYNTDRSFGIALRKQILPRLFVTYQHNTNPSVARNPATATQARDTWSVTYRITQGLFFGVQLKTNPNSEGLVLEGAFRF